MSKHSNHNEKHTTHEHIDHNVEDYAHGNHSKHKQDSHDEVNHEKHSMHKHHDHTEHMHDNHTKPEHADHMEHTHDEQMHDDHSEHAEHNHEEHSAHMHHAHGEDSGHHHHHGNFKELFLKSLPLGIVIMILSPMMGVELPFQFTFTYSNIIVAILSTVLLIYGGKPFYQGALEEFKQREPGMMALVSLGVSVSYLYSIYAVIAHYITGEHVMDFFFEFASLILIMLLGHWIEMKAVGDAGDAQKALAELVPKDAHVVLDDDSIETRPVHQLKVGDVIRVQAGENIPADGKIIKGNSRINEALLTGESKPVQKDVGDQVIGGSTNQEGVLFIEVEETGDESFISQVQTLIRQAQNQPSRAENLAHKVAGWLFYIAILVAFGAFVAWLVLEDLPTAVTYTVTTLVIACPHALGLAIPLVVARSTSLGASRGLLVKDRKALEGANRSDVIILDKTGTLTTGVFKVLDIQVLSDTHTSEDILAIMSGIESGSSHPIAQSIVTYAEAEGVKGVSFDSIDVVSGVGVDGHANGKHYQLISQKSYGKDLAIDVPAGATLSVLLEDDSVIGTVSLGDELKDSSKALIQTLNENGIQPIMATGDNEQAAKAVAEELDIEYKFNQSPQDKYDLLDELMTDGKKVIMVGDGVNDAPSLALADVGIAVGAGTKVAIDSADVILTQSDPADIRSFLELSKKTTSKMKQNLWWGAGYNFLAIPIAAGLLASFGISLTPAAGAILMSISTVIVAINAVMLKLDDEQ